MEWGRYKDLAERVQHERHEFLRAIGALPPAHDSPASSSLAGVSRRVDEVGGHDRRPRHRTPKMAGERKRGVVSKVKEGPADAALPRREKENPA
jgi:hypothetical protein